jgi:hypothetical protein
MSMTLPAPDSQEDVRNQQRHKLAAVLASVAIVISVLLLVPVGLWVGQLLADWAWRLRPATPVDLSAIRGPFAVHTNGTYLIAKVLGVGASGVSVKLALDILGALSALFLPVIEMAGKPIPTTPLSGGEVLKRIGAGIYGSGKIIMMFFGAALSLGLAAGTLADERTNVTQGPNNSYYISAGSNSFFLQVPAASAPETVSGKSFVVLFEEDKQNPDGTPAIASPGNERPGLIYTSRSTSEFLKLFADRLASCNRDSRTVAVIVKGFASSRGDDTYNRDLANDRAKKVATELRAIVTTDKSGTPLPRSEFEPFPWRLAADMKKERGFEDRVAGQYSEERGQLNRRVELIIDNAGACYR